MRRHDFRFQVSDFRSRRARAGFTLLELIVVVGVIGILIAILFPAVNMARAKAREREAASTARALENAITIYHSENGKWPVDDDTIQNLGGTLTVAQHWSAIIKLNGASSGGAPYWEYTGYVTNWSKTPPVPFSISVNATNNTVTVQ